MKELCLYCLFYYFMCICQAGDKDDITKKNTSFENKQLFSSLRARIYSGTERIQQQKNSTDVKRCKKWPKYPFIQS